MDAFIKKTTWCHSHVSAAILAGGKGTRLFPLTKYRCKPAVNFGGHYRLIDVPISNALNSHIHRIHIISQHFSQHLHYYLQTNYSANQFQGGQLNLLSPCKEQTYKGTADAIRQNISSICTPPTEYIFILSGDQLYNMDLNAMLDEAQEKESDLMIATLNVTEKEATRMGILEVDENKCVRSFIEKPTMAKLHELRFGSSCLSQEKALPQIFVFSDEVKGRGRSLQKGVNRSLKVESASPRAEISSRHKPSFLASMGIYLFKKTALQQLLKEEGDDFGKDLIPKALEKHKVCAYSHNLYWEDIGTIQSFYQANLNLISKTSLNLYNETAPIHPHYNALPSACITNAQVRRSIVCEGSDVHAQEISNSLIGVRTTIGPKTVIRNSIILGADQYRKNAARIGSHCLLDKVILDENSSIGNNVSLTNVANHIHYDSPYLYVRDNIIIVPSNVHLPNNFHF